jgi:predicted HicB family RNase H-like nuclease
MNNTLNYKGFTAKVEFSADDEVFFGRVLGIDEIVTFHADSVEELKTSMKEMIEFYLETCRKKGKKPKKNYNGRLLFRLPNELHARIAETAAKRGKSINEWGREIFELAVEK